MIICKANLSKYNKKSYKITLFIYRNMYMWQRVDYNQIQCSYLIKSNGGLNWLMISHYPQIIYSRFDDVIKNVSCQWSQMFKRTLMQHAYSLSAVVEKDFV